MLRILVGGGFFCLWSAVATALASEGTGWGISAFGGLMACVVVYKISLSWTEAEPAAEIEESHVLQFSRPEQAPLQRRSKAA